MTTQFKNFMISGILLFSTLSHAASGDLVELTFLQTVSAENAGAARKIYCPLEANVGETLSYKVYRLKYKSKGLQNEEVTVGGLLLFPETSRPLPMFVYQHQTLFSRAELPSNFPESSESRVVGNCFASRGYFSILTDYLGYGDSTGVHPYLHADSEAWVARDLMRAAKKASLQLKLELNSKIFISGYSQGGHAAMALLRLLEQDPKREFVVTAAAPMAGAYHLSKTFREVVKNPAPYSAVEGAYAVVGLNQIYHFFENLEEVFQSAYIPTISTFFDGTHSSKEVPAKFSMPIDQLFTHSFLNSHLQNLNSPFQKALKSNDVHRWVPITPLRLIHGAADIEVPFFNAQETYDYMKSKGAPVELVNLGPNINHQNGWQLAFGNVIVWFETFR